MAVAVTFPRYAALSTLLFALTMLRMFAQYPNYFTAMVALSTELQSLVILLNMAGVLTVAFGKICIKIFLGTLRPSEIEKVQQRVWLLAFDGVVLSTVFFDDGFDSIELGVYALVVIFLTVFHLVCRERVAFLYELAELPTLMYEMRISWLTLLLLAADTRLCYSVWHGLNGGPVLPLIFSTYYTDLLRSSVIMTVQLLGNFYEAHWLNADVDEDNFEEREKWELKETVNFITDITISSLTLLLELYTLYRVTLISSMLLYRLFSLSYHIYTTFKEFIAARRAKSELESYVVTASPADLIRDSTCVICREDMDFDGGKDRLIPKKMACGHVIHFGCLKSWVGRSQNCPICRQPLAGGETLSKASSTDAAVPAAGPGFVGNPAQMPAAVPAAPPANEDANERRNPFVAVPAPGAWPPVDENPRPERQNTPAATPVADPPAAAVPVLEPHDLYRQGWQYVAARAANGGQELRLRGGLWRRYEID